MTVSPMASKRGLARSKSSVLVCEECGEELRVRGGIELDLVAESWAEEQRRRGGKVYQEMPPEVLAIANHPHGELSFINKSTGERLFASWGGIDARGKLRRLEAVRRIVAG